MKLRIWQRHAVVDPWDDAPDDPLPTDVAALVADDTSAVDAAVARRRPIVLAAYRVAARDMDLHADLLAARRQPSMFPARRRWAFALTTAMLTLVVGVAGVAASGAGGVLYPLRLATEEAFLPGGGSDRLAGQLDRLDHRVQEAEAASVRGDRHALEAALAAYEAIARDVEAAGPETLDLPTERRGRFRDQVLAQVRRLEGLAAGLAPFETIAIGQAVDAGSRLESRVQRQNGSGPGGGQGDGGSPVSPVATPRPSPATGPAGSPPGAGPHGQSSDAPGKGGTVQGSSGLGGRPEPGAGAH
jgi:hypothetical protein